MQTLSGFPFFTVHFDKRGDLVDRAEVDALVGHVRQAKPSDLLVMSHGWNNNTKEAQGLYEALAARLRAQAGVLDGASAGRTPSIVGLFWPSKKFDEEELISGGSASAGAMPGDPLKRQLDNLQGDDAFDEPDADEMLARARELVDDLEDDPRAQREYVRIMRTLIASAAASTPPDDAIPEEFFQRSGPDLLQQLSDGEPEPSDEGGAAGGVGSAAGVGSVLGGIRDGARKLLNFTTYYQMKERAGTVGSRGVSPVLREVRQADPGVRIHLIGHSFGGRLVTAAASESDEGAITSMTLLQAAFSHNGFAQDYKPGRNGFFRGVVTGRKVRGPILVTHTHNDTAVGLAYAIASRIAGQEAARLVGGVDDTFGGIGANGARMTPESDPGTTALLAAGQPYAFRAGRLHNLRADAFIRDHSDVASDATAYAILSAVATT